MPTRAEAKEHIESFWTRRRIARNAVDIENDINIRDLSNSLKILSDGLYGDLTHFFWELLQNADDSEYTATPRVDFTLTNESLTYQTNEAGFTLLDVESLCAVGCSSKTGQDDKIGEKGIGFKSLFKIADVVSIHSGVYSFKLDTGPPLGNVGMVLPIWLDAVQDFPGTSIHLKFKPGLDIPTLRQHLFSFDFTFLLFTRKIKVINLNVGLNFGLVFEKLGQLQHLGPDCKRIETRINGRPDTTMDYDTYRQTYINMPQRQPGAQVQSDNEKTTIVLAFPHRNQQPMVQTQKTYAYLPVTSFGFQFIIHADFILTANRNDVDGDRKWNKSIQKCLPSALCLAFERLAASADTRMQHHWPEYLGCLWFIYDPFMKVVADMTIDLLRSKPLVQTELLNGGLLAPRDALSASDDFRDTEGELLVPEGIYARKVRSSAYSTDSSRILAKMGVAPYEISHFIKDLDRYISGDITAFSSKTGAWHSRVARLLYKNFSGGMNWRNSTEYLAFNALRIIPLEDGSWVSGDSCHVTNVFLYQDHRMALPAGLDFCFVQPSAADDRDRKQLYRLLGVEPCDDTEICRMIIKSHATGRIASLKDHIAHAVYLFHARYQPPFGGLLRIRLVDSNFNIRYQERVHLPFGTEGKTVKRLFSDDFSDIIWLHSSYEDAVEEGERKDWCRFLSLLDGVYVLPPFQSYGRLSVAMRHILERNGSKEFLEHLKMRHRLHFSDRLRASDVNDAYDAEAVNMEIGNIEVSTDRGLRKLCETILPSLSAFSLGLLPLLQLNDPADTEWNFLCKFGVQTEFSPDFLLKQLRSLKAGSNPAQVKQLATTVYNAIAVYPALERSTLASFRTENLIYVDPGRWVLPNQCIWKASFPCAKVPVLSKIYRGCQNLFQKLLDVRDAGLDDLILELASMEAREGPEHANLLCQQMLPALDSFLGKHSLSELQRQQLLELHIFPVTQGESEDHPPTTSFLRAQDTFWIADLNWLKLKFEGCLPLLDMTGGLFKSPMCNIFVKLSMDSKRLSKSVKKEENQSNQQEPSEVPDPVLTNRLRRQSQYIIGIVCNNDKPVSNLDQVTAMLSNIVVFRVPTIIVKRFVLDGGIKRYGRDDEGEVVLIDADPGLHVKIRQGLEIMDIIVPLAERFAERYDLGDTSRGLLAKVLTTERVEQFMEALERAGVRITPTTFVEVATEDDNDEDSDDDILPEDLDDSLGIAFRQLQISDVTGGSVSDRVFRESQQRRLAPAPNEPNGRRSDARISSPISLQRRSAHASISGADATTVTTIEPAAIAEVVARLAERLSNATLFDATRDVFRHRCTIPTPSGAESSESQVPVFGTGTSFQFNFSLPARQPRVNNIDVDASIQTGTNLSTTSGTIVGNSPDSQSDSDSVHSLPGHTDSRLVTPTRPIRRAIGHLPSGRSFRSSYGGNSFVARESTADTPHEIGLAGEHLVYKFLEEKLSPSFTPENWTSRNRNKVFSNPFSSEFREKDFADFTYVDTEGRLRQYLREQIPTFECPTVQSNITYHLEVKTTLGELGVPALLSNNQISMAKKYSGRFSTPATQTDVYILVRVYGVGSDPPRPEFCLFPDPWNLICLDSLRIEGESGIYVRPKSPG